MTSIPFDMQRIGAHISRLRKQHGLTQMQLADALGISFQAVSNWERGQSMPDISKLPELAALFGTTIDALLGRHCVVLEQAASGQLEDHLNTAQVTPAEAAEAAPLLPPQQAEVLAEHAVTFSLTNGDLSGLSELLPFMSTPQLDRLLQKHLDDGQYDMFLPFCSNSAIDAAVHSQLEAGRSISPFLPFLSTLTLLEVYQFRSARGDSTAELFPFLPTATLDQFALEKNECGEDFTSLLPFISPNAIMQLCLLRVRQKQSISMLLPFLPTDFVDQLASDR